VDEGEGDSLWSGGRSGSSLRPLCGHCGPIHAEQRRENAPQANVNQAHQHKHFALIRLPALCWQIWVFRISVSMRRLGRSPCRPPQATGLWFACRTTRWHRPS